MSENSFITVKGSYRFEWGEAKHIRIREHETALCQDARFDLLIIVRNGAARLQGRDGDKGESPIRSGQFVWLQANSAEISLFALSPVCAFDVFSFQFRSEQVEVITGTLREEPEFPEAVVPYGQVLELRTYAKAVELVEELLQPTCRDATSLQFYYRYLRFQELLLMIISWHEQQSRQAAASAEAGIGRSIQYMNVHYSDALTVEQLADIAWIEPWKYPRLFKGATGKSPLQYLNDMRMDKAKQLLVAGEDKLSDIAQQIGFANEYYFSRRFKQTIGIAPGQYRRNHREQPRIVAPYLEDFLVALGVMPIAQYWHAKWGKQDYLRLSQTPVFDEMELATASLHAIADYRPDLILLMDHYDDTLYKQCRRITHTCVMPESTNDWRMVLRRFGDFFGREELAERILTEYTAKAAAAREALRRKLRGETVAFLRVSADYVLMYTDCGGGFAVSVLYEDLGLQPYRLSGTEESSSGFGDGKMIALSGEQLAGLSADHLFVVFDKWHSGRPGEERMLLSSQVWKGLAAVRKLQAYEMDFLTWMNNGVISNGKKIDDIMRVLAI
ncbi:helix-turn-helix domain-containing protein [Paenibacillus sp. 1011MAR3C5]|uniref:helix-turn-helix domain-containing protein n=1 Tax=Paenibacillus sp. 1011MAR3C5 TaxID=1675787 RepID=UPI0016020F42|nr:AraC family transcriptional regulator [Paenibacillus sp. 1011MAR3C5]